MNERQHIALTEAQIIAAEKGELQLETRDGRKVVQLAWFRSPYDQNCSDIITAVVVDIEGFAMTHSYYKTGIYKTNRLDCLDLFVSKPTEQEQVSPKPLYEVGEIIEVKAIDSEKWKDAEFIAMSRNYCLIWMNDIVYRYSSEHHRKKQKPCIYISGRITGIDYKEAFALFEAAENELISKGYDVCNPIKEVPYNKDWSWFDYLSADIKLMEKCTHIYMLSNWRESGGASVEHEAAKWNNFTIIYQ